MFSLQDAHMWRFFVLALFFIV